MCHCGFHNLLCLQQFPRNSAVSSVDFLAAAEYYRRTQHISTSLNDVTGSTYERLFRSSTMGIGQHQKRCACFEFLCSGVFNHIHRGIDDVVLWPEHAHFEPYTEEEVASHS